jgi:hypothetical protein
MIIMSLASRSHGSRPGLPRSLNLNGPCRVTIAESGPPPAPVTPPRRRGRRAPGPPARGPPSLSASALPVSQPGSASASESESVCSAATLAESEDSGSPPGPADRASLAVTCQVGPGAGAARLAHSVGGPAGGPGGSLRAPPLANISKSSYDRTRLCPFQ